MKQLDSANTVLRRAKSLASWSFVGVLAPIVGVILGFMSRSTLNELKPTSSDDVKNINKIRNLANWGLVVSTIVFVLYFAGGMWAYNVAKTAQEEERQRTATELRQQQEAAEQAQTGEETRRFLLQQCLNETDDWYNNNLKNVTTVYQEQNLIQQRQQEIDKCEMLYGS